MRNEQIYSSWSKVKPDAAAHERMLANILERSQKRSIIGSLKIIMPIAACVIVFLAVFISRLGVEPPPSTVVPQPVYENLTIYEARGCPNFGMFIPTNIPEEFTLDRVWRTIHQDAKILFVFWHSGMDSVTWQVANATAHDLSLVVDVNDRAMFDLSLYTIPWFQSVPEDLLQYVTNPVFLAQEITIDAVQARAVESRDGGVHMNFSVLFGNVVVTISANGLLPQDVWEMILSIL